MTKWFWLETTYACGAIWIDEEAIIRGGAPIYRRWCGVALDTALCMMTEDKEFVAIKPLDAPE